VASSSYHAKQATEFNRPTGPVLGLLNSIQPVGAVVGLPFITPIVDSWGRRWSIVWGASWTIIGAILQASAYQIPQFVIARFLIGFGLAFTVVGSPLLLAELALPKHRGAIMSYFPTVWFTGAIIAAWTTFGTRHIQNSWSWRIPSLLQAVPAAIQILGIFFIPESPRYLVSKGREQEAKKILAKHHANGNEHDPLVELEFYEITQAINQDARHKANGNWKDLVRTAANRRRLIIVFFCGLFIEISGNGLVQYYLGSVLNSIGITSTTTKTTINGCLAIYNFLLATIASFFVERIGRRPLFIISTTGMLIAFILWTTFAALYTTYQTNGYAIGVLVSIFLSNGAYDIGWTPLYSYPVEILPYEIRARGVTLQTGIIHTFGFFGTFVNPIGLQNSGWKYYIAYIVYTFLEVGHQHLSSHSKPPRLRCNQLLVVWYFFVETRSYNLEEISTIFEAENITWKQRRNMKPPRIDIPDSDEKWDRNESKVAVKADEKEIKV
jgi:sugar porter (SP) family MFS transporter